MAQALNESLSACFDGEAPRDELRRVLDESNSSEDLRGDWLCYSSISAVLRGEKLSSLKCPRNWEELAERIPDDHNIVALQGKRRVNRKSMIGGATAILAMAATLVIGVYVLNPVDDAPPNQSIGRFGRPDFDRECKSRFTGSHIYRNSGQLAIGHSTATSREASGP